jgi:hypothetical protein
MAGPTTKKRMSEQDWLKLSRMKSIHNRMTMDSYSMAYPALLSHFRNLNEIDWNCAVLGLHIVYGWMPTIPRLDRILALRDENSEKLVIVLKRVRKNAELSDEDIELLKSFCNNSIISASKMLHFLNPDAYPIWDSRVAKIFLKNPRATTYQINKISVWTEYRNTLLQWSSSGHASKQCASLRKLAPFLKDVSDLRLVELVMFHRKKSKRR